MYFLEFFNLRLVSGRVCAESVAELETRRTVTEENKPQVGECIVVGCAT